MGALFKSLVVSLMASHSEEYELVKEDKVLHIFVYCLRKCTALCSCMQNVCSQGHCTSSRVAEYNQFDCTCIGLQK